MNPSRILMALSVTWLLAGCASRIEEVPPSVAPLPGPVMVEELAPLEGYGPKAEEAPVVRDGQWASYRWPRRDGSWRHGSAWSHPPRDRNGTMGRALVAHPLYLPGEGSILSAVAAVPSSSDMQWAETWVSEADRQAFETALASAGRGIEGRWTSVDGSKGIALPARLAGDCRIIDLMLTSADGLPVLSRGTVRICA